MTLLEIQTELARETNKATSPLDATTKARFLAAINRHYRRVASLPGLQHLRDTTTTFDSVDGQASYDIGSVAKVNHVYRASPQLKLLPMTTAQYLALAPDPLANPGLPQFFIWQTYTGTGATQKWRLSLYPTPNDVRTYSAGVTALLTPLALDADVPILPTDFHDLLFLGALEDEYRHLDDTRANVVAASRREREAQFKYWMHETASGMTPIGVNGVAAPSQLGPWFGAGT
jgi:hypothetical protein